LLFQVVYVGKILKKFSAHDLLRFMTLTKHVKFTATLQQGNRIQVPRLVRWQFRLEPIEVLHVSVRFLGQWSSREQFYAQMHKDGRISIPALQGRLLETFYSPQNLLGAIVEVELDPSTAENTDEDQ
jgi:hypothetical protein